MESASRPSSDSRVSSLTLCTPITNYRTLRTLSRYTRITTRPREATLARRQVW
ncbi:hypothetical protein L914_18039 [Phytophthora nicotianae]|uniref:Uncharacterized protein n=1 Tax=Phytophthora nicotianae TaxID=4792 RepID=W2MHM8_PHYNI|nr:hypothetical protein L914_18039 [Phytophthora nicotianae]